MRPRLANTVQRRTWVWLRLSPNCNIYNSPNYSPKNFDGAHTLKLFSWVGDSCLLTMIDSGASHCFISSQIAQMLHLLIDVAAQFDVVLGDGTWVSSQSVCTAIRFTIVAVILYHLLCVSITQCRYYLGGFLACLTWWSECQMAKLTMVLMVQGQKIGVHGESLHNAHVVRRTCTLSKGVMMRGLCGSLKVKESFLFWRRWPC